VTGDSPYLPWEEVQYPLAVREMDETDLAFVLDVGDIFWRPCSDAHYRKVRARFERSLHPLFYTPGDNEWADCWEPASGAFRPLERLAAIRTIFFGEPRRSFGAKKIDAETQADDPRFPELRENVPRPIESALAAKLLERTAIDPGQAVIDEPEVHLLVGRNLHHHSARPKSDPPMRDWPPMSFSANTSAPTDTISLMRLTTSALTPTVV